MQKLKVGTGVTTVEIRRTLPRGDERELPCRFFSTPGTASANICYSLKYLDDVFIKVAHRFFQLLCSLNM